jgi:hypothetical protein
MRSSNRELSKSDNSMKLVLQISALSISIALCICGCENHSTGPELDLELVEKMRPFNKAKFDWEVLIVAWAAETKQLGRFSYIGFNPDLYSNNLWKVYEDSANYGRLYIANIQQILECPPNSVWIETYSIEDRMHVFYNPRNFQCNDLIPYIK